MNNNEEEVDERVKLPFQAEENLLLVELYINGRSDYEGRFSSASKNGDSLKQGLQREWAQKISALGFKLRTADSISQRIRDLLKLARKYNSHERAEFEKTGGGTRKVLKKPEWVLQLADAIRDDVSATGFTTTLETGVVEVIEERVEYDGETYVAYSDNVKPERKPLTTPNSKKRKHENTDDISYEYKMRYDLITRETELCETNQLLALKKLELVEAQLDTSRRASAAFRQIETACNYIIGYFANK